MHKNMIHLFCQFNQVFRNSTLYFKYFSKVEVTGAFLLPSQLGDNPSGKETWSFLLVRVRTSQGLMSCPTRNFGYGVHSLGFCCLHTMWMPVMKPLLLSTSVLQNKAEGPGPHGRH